MAVTLERSLFTSLIAPLVVASAGTGAGPAPCSEDGVCTPLSNSMLQVGKKANKRQELVTLIHGVRVYGYHNAIVAGSSPHEKPVALLQHARGEEQAEWILPFPTDFSDEQLHAFCDSINNTGAKCDHEGHPTEGGLTMDTFRATKAELGKVLKLHPELEWVEADSVIEMSDEKVGFDDQVGFDDKDRNHEDYDRSIPWGLDRVDGAMDGSYQAVGDGAGVHVYVLDTGV